MAGKVLTAEDFEKGGDPTKEDTSSKGIPADKMIPADQKFTEEDIPKEEPKLDEVPKDEEAKVEPLPKPSDEFKPKHKTWEETEKARLELERGFHDKSMRASELEKKVAQYEKPPEKPIPTEDERIAEITDEALKNINALPGDSPTRDRDAAIVWGKAQRKISRLEIDESNRFAQSEREIVTKTYEKAQKEGIKTDAELRILGFEFSKIDSYLDMDDRIKQAVESTKGILSQIRDGFVRDQERDKKEKDDLKVLGRGSTRKDKPEEKGKPTTMSQQLAELNEKRRMTKDDLR